jgi:protein-S-isoprenylcysteine O-methyltransferase Ste14
MESLVRAGRLFLAGFVIFVGFPILAWDWYDLAGFLQHPARLGYVLVTTALTLFVAVAMPEAGQCHRNETKSVARQRVALVLMQVCCIFLVMAAPYCDARDVAVWRELAPLRFFGLFLFAVGYFLVSWSAAVLGKQFSVYVAIQQGHELVTRGPYRYVRHPRYAGTLLFLFGYALLFRSWIAMGLLAMFAAVLAWRIHDEEALLHEQFSDAWVAYARRTARLIPFVF